MESTQTNVNANIHIMYSCVSGFLNDYPTCPGTMDLISRQMDKK